MAATIGSLRHSFAERSKEKLLLSRKEYSELGLGGSGSDRRREGFVSRFFHSIKDHFSKFCSYVPQVAVKAYQIGRSDPRKIIFALKMGLALSIVSLLIFFKQPLSYIGQNSIWAILTVVVVFEFSIGRYINQFLFFSFLFFFSLKKC